MSAFGNDNTTTRKSMNVRKIELLDEREKYTTYSVGLDESRGGTPTPSPTLDTNQGSVNIRSGSDSTCSTRHLSSANKNCKGEVPDAVSVIRTTAVNRTKDSMSMLLEKTTNSVLREYKKGRDIVPPVKKIIEINTDKWKPLAPTRTGTPIVVPEAEMV